MKASTKTKTMSFTESISTVFNKYAEFNGRASRSEFWWWTLFTFLVAAVIGSFSAIQLGDDSSLGSMLQSVWSIAILLPSLGVAIRRLRDAGLGWGHIFWGLIPFAGLIVLIIFWSQPSKK